MVAQSSANPRAVYDEKVKIHKELEDFVNGFKDAETTPKGMKNVRMQGGF